MRAVAVGDPEAAGAVSHDLISAASIGRPITLLSCAAFVSVASMRVGDPLLPQVAHEFGVSAGDASVIATAFALAYGLCQLVWGALGDWFGKYRLMTLISALTAVPPPSRVRSRPSASHASQPAPRLPRSCRSAWRSSATMSLIGSARRWPRVS
jgi:MFS family permease